MKSSIRYSLYHSLLRVLVVAFAFLLVFDSGLLVNKTKDLSTSTQDYLANVVGVKVGVAPNEVNQLTARITELEKELEAKERLIAINLNEGEVVEVDKSTFILSLILFILLVLIVLNYIMDYMRVRKLVVKNST